MSEPAPPSLDWQRLKEVVADALDLPPGERGRFLDAVCAGDPPLRAEAGRLSAAGDDDTHVLHPRVDAFLGLSGPDPAALAGHRFAGKYELLRLLGEGGMAAVYLARQDGVERPVAVKIVRPHALGYDARRRFAKEVRAQGRLDHPGVARVYDAGVWRDPSLPGAQGVPFIAMEYVDGPPLTRFADERKLSLAGRLRLLADAAEAVHAAHQRAIVHRDLKPANVLVTRDGRPKVLDFGIARVLETGDAEARSLQTTAGVLLGTLGYMAPEQAGGGGDRVDVRSDVWSLGVMLHELVVGRLPVETLGVPLTVALRRLSDPDVTAAGIGPILGDDSGGDLTAVLTTALASEPDRRYPSAEALADDLRRVLRHEPVAARRPTRRYLARKFVRRHRAGVAAAATVAVVLVAAAAVSTAGFVREAAARAGAEQSLAAANAEIDRSNAARAFVSEVLSASDIETAEGGAGVTLLDAIRAAEPRLGEYVRGDPLVEADMRLTLARALRSLGEIDDAAAQYRLAIAAAWRVEEFDERATGTRRPAWLWPIELHFELAGSLANEGDAARGRGEYEAAAEAFRDAPDRPSTHRPRVEFEAKRSLAQVLDAEGRYAESADLWVECVALAEALLERGANPVDSAGITLVELAATKNGAGSAMLSAGRVEEAARLLRAELADREALLGATNPTTIRARHNLAHALAEAGDVDGAETAFRRCLAESLETVGEDHPLTLGVRNGLGSALISRQTPAALGEAVGLAEANLAGYARRGQAESPDAISSLNNRATALAYLGRDAEAAEAYRDAAGRATATYGPEHHTTLVLRANLARSLSEVGDRAAAVAELREVYAAQQRTLGDRDPSTVITRNNLAMILLDDGRADEAAAELRACHAIAQEQGWGGMAPQFRRGVGKALTAAGDYAGAERELLRAYDELAPLGAAHQAKAAGYLADLYERWGRGDDAAAWRGKSGGG